MAPKNQAERSAETWEKLDTERLASELKSTAEPAFADPVLEGLRTLKPVIEEKIGTDGWSVKKLAEWLTDHGAPIHATTLKRKLTLLGVKIPRRGRPRQRPVTEAKSPRSEPAPAPVKSRKTSASRSVIDLHNDGA